MSATRKKDAGALMSELQSFQMHQAVKALERCHAVCRSMSVYARFTHAIAGDGRLEEMERTVWDLGILADTVAWLQLDATESLEAAFPDMPCRYWEDEDGG